MNTKIDATILLILCILAGCAAPTPIPDIQPKMEATSTSTLLAPTVTALPLSTKQMALTSTPTLAVSTLTALPLPTIDADASLPGGCVKPRSIAFDPATITGYLIVQDSRMDDHLFDPQTNQFLDVDKEGHKTFYPSFISPNKKYMLAEDDKYNYVLRTVDNVITNIPNPIEWFAPRWLDNEHVAFLNTKTPKQDIIILNPFTGEQQNIHLEIPNAKSERIGLAYSVIFYAIDPTLKRVFFNDQSGRLVLWDIESQKELASLPSPAGDTHLPFMWSPDGKKYVTPWPEISAGKIPANELYVFGMDGSLEQLTHLNSKYAFANVEDPFWSPDGRRIGFWLRIGETDSNPQELPQWPAVLDTENLETTIYCLNTPQPEQAYYIAWSPNGQQLIVSFDPPGKQVTSILVDITNQTQTIIDTQNMVVRDWMVR
jgi:hypothetical protein